ncbi:MAG: 50S ribosomal protein L23 [Myxococcota bacterium]|nr:50S ribosomal protein L23 [Myxococcota bacterium]
MSTAYDVIIRPVLTEKSLRGNAAGKYVFEVAPSANKVQIKAAVEKLFSVNVESVSTLVLRGKVKRIGRFMGQKPNRKRAVVTLKSGQSIQIYEAKE